MLCYPGEDLEQTETENSNRFFSDCGEETMEPSYEDFEPSAFGFVGSSLFSIFPPPPNTRRGVFVQEAVKKEEH
jgi:hypothetical protein